ncbi:MAG: hypothetical protein PUG16_04850 [Lachnospiraceae bacterium]|nr:hypothetical protein [Lachnospiraceae bacterium]
MSTSADMEKNLMEPTEASEDARILVDLELTELAVQAIAKSSEEDHCIEAANELLQALHQEPMTKDEFIKAGKIKVKADVMVPYQIRKTADDYTVEIEDAELRNIDQKVHAFEDEVRSIYDPLKEGPFVISVYREGGPSARRILKKFKARLVK